MIHRVSNLKFFLPESSGPAKNKKTFKKWTQYLLRSSIFNVGLSQMTEVFSSSLSEFLVCEWAASACYRWWCTGLGVRTKLLADLVTKEFETIFDQKDLGSLLPEVLKARILSVPI
jgi:hypothetical protein